MLRPVHHFVDEPSTCLTCARVPWSRRRWKQEMQQRRGGRSLVFLHSTPSNILSSLCFCRAMLCKRGLSRHAVSVCVSVTFVDFVNTNKHIFKIFWPSDGHTILIFPYQDCRWGIGRNRDSEPMSGFTACCQRSNRPTVVNTTLSDHGRASCKRLSLLIAGDDYEMFMTRSLNVTPKTTEQHFNCTQW